MKISLNWLKKYVKIPETVSDDELIRLIGARLVEVEGVIDETHKYDNIYVVRVESCEKIPETHLTLCKIDAGGELVQVVCGAPNVREGMLAVWIAPGAVVPASAKEDAPFVIGKRKMRGFESCGMLAGADELDFGDDHSGIVEIDPNMAKPGDKLAVIFELEDLILEIENKSLTHRPDCFGIIGFAREVAGILGERFIEPAFLTHEDVFPEGFLIGAGKHDLKSKESDLKVKIADNSLCGRYTIASIKINEEHLKGEKYLSNTQILLAKSGMKSVSKIVDVTNILMLLTGQPLHAFDYDKFLKVGKSESPNIIVRLAKPGEKLLLLDEKEISCTENDILITSNDIPVALAGAMGGKETEIDENTRNVLLESATFSLFNLRKTQMTHGLFTEAITRFTKGVSTGETFNVLAEAIKEMGAKPLALYDAFPGWHEGIMVNVSVEEINTLLGTNYDEKLIKNTLQNVGFEVEKNGSYLKVFVPIWRTDIHIKEDVIEEVGRLLGYDNINPVLPLHVTAFANREWELKKRIRNLLSKYGANELLTYSFVSERLLKKAGLDPKNSYKIVNSISPDLQLVRQSLIPSLLDKAFLNEKLPVNQFAIFEMNKVYRKEWGLDKEKVPVEKTQLAMVLADRKYNDKTAFYQAKKYAAKVFDELGINVQYVPLKQKIVEGLPFEPKRSAEIVMDGECIGVVGEFKNSVKAEFKLADYLAGFEINLDCILDNMNNHYSIDLRKREYRDLTLNSKKSYDEVVRDIENVLKEHEIEASITPVSIYQADNSDEKHISVRLGFVDFNEKIMNVLENLY